MRWWSVRLWGAHLLGLVCVLVAAGMGLWQYDAFQERRAAERLDLTAATPVDLAGVLGPDEPFPAADVGRPVEVRGTWLPEGTVLVADRAGADGASGRWLVTPLTVGDADAPAVPVVRGWVPDDADLADLPVPAGEATVLGWVQPPEGSNAVDDDPADDVLPELRTADLVQRVEVDLYGAYVIAEVAAPEDAAAGVVAATLDQLPPASRFTGLRNILYAIEWWVFAAFAAFLWFRHVRDTTAEAPLPEGDDEDAGDRPVPSEA